MATESVSRRKCVGLTAMIAQAFVSARRCRPMEEPRTLPQRLGATKANQ